VSQELRAEFGEGFSYSALTRMVHFAESMTEIAQNAPTDCLEREDNGHLHLSECPILTCIGMTDPTRT
jgi:hypothetical protein